VPWACNLSYAQGLIENLPRFIPPLVRIFGNYSLGRIAIILLNSGSKFDLVEIGW